MIRSNISVSYGARPTRDSAQGGGAPRSLGVPFLAWLQRYERLALMPSHDRTMASLVAAEWRRPVSSSSSSGRTHVDQARWTHALMSWYLLHTRAHTHTHTDTHRPHTHTQTTHQADTIITIYHIPSRYVTSQLGQLSLASLRGRLIEYQIRLR